MCSDVSWLLSTQLSLVEFLEVHPYLTAEDVRNCLQYCSSCRCIADQPEHYCVGCTFDSYPPPASPQNFLPDDEALRTYLMGDVRETAFMGTPEEFEASARKHDYWLVARALLKRMDFRPDPPHSARPVGQD